MTLRRKITYIITFELRETFFADLTNRGRDGAFKCGRMGRDLRAVGCADPGFSRNSENGFGIVWNSRYRAAMSAI